MPIFPPSAVKLGISWVTGFPPVYINVAPLAIVVIPKVAINAGIPVNAMNPPFTAPNSAPTPIAAMIGIITGNSPILGKNF